MRRALAAAGVAVLCLFTACGQSEKPEATKLQAEAAFRGKFVAALDARTASQSEAETARASAGVGADGAAAPEEKRHASKDGHDVDRVPEALWKLYGSPRRPDPTRTRPQIDAETQEPPADTRIGPAVARIRALFASRRSPVRSRLAPLRTRRWSGVTCRHVGAQQLPHV